VVLLLFRGAPLGELNLLYTLNGVILAQAVLAFPVVAALTAAAVHSLRRSARPGADGPFARAYKGAIALTASAVERAELERLSKSPFLLRCLVEAAHGHPRRATTSSCRSSWWSGLDFARPSSPEGSRP
jgi:hypothetical protein